MMALSVLNELFVFSSWNASQWSTVWLGPWKGLNQCVHARIVYTASLCSVPAGD